MEHTLESRVGHAVVAWLDWLPSWQPSTHRGRTRICRRCFGSPLIASAGLDGDVPHAVQHSLATRLTAVIDDEVDRFTAAELPLLAAELSRAERRNARRYRPDRGLPPELSGAPLDPEPVDGAPYLFTLAELAGQPLAAQGPGDGRREASGATDEDAEHGQGEHHDPLDAEHAALLREQIGRADVCARQLGYRVCELLAGYRGEIGQAVAADVEPKVTALLGELGDSLELPPTAW
ncbi:hypothetical protein [Mycetocola reblochoni]|uniref:Spermidine/putrescine ABC transporter substrate-binding protein n=2 Tax=Mycetocola reblochoni TaxID=331618 RepID=A0A1R4ICQ3_9MICO|nr:hypothetical protein [Mycetocola reblochoni]RLP69118.1 spermidine/putrescine ABC transporter substrate-binding protein [Mycetocola reblochoni]SJN17598.1 hypothetical protein FM119_01045 [Mycetocola reblochoni REB411]